MTWRPWRRARQCAWRGAMTDAAHGLRQRRAQGMEERNAVPNSRGIQEPRAADDGVLRMRPPRAPRGARSTKDKVADLYWACVTASGGITGFSILEVHERLFIGTLCYWKQWLIESHSLCPYRGRRFSCCHPLAELRVCGDASDAVLHLW